MVPWPKVKDDRVTKSGWRTLVEKTFQAPDGREDTYTIVDSNGTRVASVIALTPDNKVIIAEQFRAGPEVVLQDIPGGLAEEGEDLEAVALRELREETGYATTDIQYLGKVYKDAYSNAEGHFFIARNCVIAGEQELDETEFVDVKLISIDELIENARTGAMVDVAAVFYAYDQLQAIKQEG